MLPNITSYHRDMDRFLAQCMFFHIFFVFCDGPPDMTICFLWEPREVNKCEIHCEFTVSVALH
jgi:hypothetical protein